MEKIYYNECSFLVVSRVMRKINSGSGRNLLQGAANRPLVTFQRAGRKWSRAAERRSSCPCPFVTWLLSAHQDLLFHGFQVLHVHVFLAAPLGSGYMAQPGTYQH